MENQLGKRSTSILIADDFDAWRAQVRDILKARPELLVVGEASDGLQAVQQALKLQPDIVLLDLAMPSLNGIEAAKIISRNRPESRILFVTQEGDGDVKQAAKQAGAMGYVLKSAAGRDLLDAISTALGQETASSRKSR